MKDPKVISLDQKFAQLRFVGDRKPTSSEKELEGAFSELSNYRDGAIYIGHYAGDSEWERHPKGDEVVYVLEGETTLILLGESEDSYNHLTAGEILVVPKNRWHRFETPKGVKILSVTPEPGDHSADRPSA